MQKSKLQFKNQMKTKVSLEKKIKRGKESWQFFYTIFGILLAITLFLISVAPIEWYWKLILFIVALLFLLWLCIFNTRFQNKLIGWKHHIEETWRKI